MLTRAQGYGKSLAMLCGSLLQEPKSYGGVRGEDGDEEGFLKVSMKACSPQVKLTLQVSFLRI